MTCGNPSVLKQEFIWKVVLVLEAEPVERPPVPPVGGGAHVCAGASCYDMGKFFWARADVGRMLFCKVTTKKGRQKIEGQLL